MQPLRLHAGRWLARVAAGETIEITDRVRLVAILSPLRKLPARERLVAEGRLVRSRGR